jgi:hypothetical protein
VEKRVIIYSSRISNEVFVLGNADDNNIVEAERYERAYAEREMHDGKSDITGYHFETRDLAPNSPHRWYE